MISRLRTLRALGMILTMWSVSACSFDNIVKVDDPESEGNLTRNLVRSREGAIGMYNSAIGQLSAGVSDMSQQVALMTDELTVRPSTSTDYQGLRRYEDSRVDTVNQWGIRGIGSEAYEHLHAARIRASQARTVFMSLKDSTLNYLIAATYAIEGYTIVMLAENICSGNPLSEVPFEGDMVLSSGLSTEQLFTIAVSKFDSALAIAHDSTRFITLARIGKGRAHMGLGQYAQAAAAVADAEPGVEFVLTYSSAPAPGFTASRSVFWADTMALGTRTTFNNFEILNREGTNGLVWYTTVESMDPRVPLITRKDNDGVIHFASPSRPAKRVNGSLPFPLARWVEAKMIQAEYYLSIEDARWLEALNEARRTVGLTDTTDPGSVESRVNLIFRERAYWFYLEATRLADYRRLVRQYKRSPAQVYPSGAYTRNRDFPFYGETYVLSPPDGEYKNNYLYHGCLNRNP